MIAEEIRVHPAADLFPMLSDDELADLAADIKEHGLLHPIVIDKEGVLIDGRNRLAACRLAGVTPEFTTLNGHEPIAFILSQNIARRHLSKGQQALLVLRARDLDSKSTDQQDLAASLGISAARMANAAVILDWANEKGDAIIGSREKFDDVLKIARDRKAAASSEAAQMKRLRVAAPDLAELVADEHMTLAEALGALKVRQEQEASKRRATSTLADTTLAFLDPGSNATVDERVDQIMATLDADCLPTHPDFSEARMRRCAAVLVAVADRIAEAEEDRGSDVVPVE